MTAIHILDLHRSYARPSAVVSDDYRVEEEFDCPTDLLAAIDAEVARSPVYETRQNFIRHAALHRLQELLPRIGEPDLRHAIEDNLRGVIVVDQVLTQAADPSQGAKYQQ